MAQLPTSSSDGNLISRLVPRRREDSNEEEKGVLSEVYSHSSQSLSHSLTSALQGEPSHQSNGMRLRLFGRSDTSSSKEKEREKRLSGSSSKRDSGEKDFSKQPATVGVRHARSKRSLDVAKSSDRLSLFGGVLMTASLGKGRKPPPRYSGCVFPSELRVSPKKFLQQR